VHASFGDPITPFVYPGLFHLAHHAVRSGGTELVSALSISSTTEAAWLV
jgi:hypothetical protein